MTTNTMGRYEAVRVLAALVDFVCAEMRGLESKPKLKAAIATLRAQGEPVVAGWQYRRAGSDDAWTNGTEYGNHQQNTEADPEWETRLVYAFPHAHPAPQHQEPTT